MTSDQAELAKTLDRYSQHALNRLYEVLLNRNGAGNRDGTGPGNGKDIRPRRQDVIEGLATFLGSEEHLRLVEEYASEWHWRVLQLPRLQGEAVPLYTLFTRLGALGLSEAQALLTLSELLSLGALVYARLANASLKMSLEHLELKPFGRLIPCVFSFAPLLERARQLAPPIPLSAASIAPFQVVQGRYGDLQRDIYLLLQAAGNGNIRVTVKGIPYKADAAKLAALLGGKSLAGPSVRSKAVGAKADVSSSTPRLWFVLALLLRSGLAHWKGERLMAAPNVREFFSTSLPEQVSHLHSAWLGCIYSEFERIETLVFDYGRREPPWVGDEDNRVNYTDIPNPARLKKARQTIGDVLRRAPLGGQWIPIAELAPRVWQEDPEFLVPLLRHAYYGYYSNYYYQQSYERKYDGVRRAGRDFKSSQLRVGQDWREVEGKYVERVIVESLHWLGLVDLGLDQAGQPMSFRMTPLGLHVLQGDRLVESSAEAETRADGPALVVQPNFDVVVFDVAGNFGLLAQLDDFAERQSLDRAAIYRLTREALVSGLEKGLVGTEVMGLLESTSRQALPQNVRYSLEEWVRLYERIHLRRAARLVEADEPAQMDAWFADSQLRPLLGRRLSPVAALVLADNWENVVELLRKGRADKDAADFVRLDYARPKKRLFSFAATDTILVPVQNDEPYLRYQLGRFADLVSDAPVMIDEAKGLLYRLTPQSVQRAVKARYDVDEIVHYLVSKATEEVPSDTILRIKGWGGGFKPFAHETVVAVELPQGVSLEELEEVPEIACYILRSFRPSLAMVAADDFEAVRALLAERGITLNEGLARERKALPPAPAAEAIVPLEDHWRRLLNKIVGDNLGGAGDSGPVQEPARSRDDIIGSSSDSVEDRVRGALMKKAFDVLPPIAVTSRVADRTKLTELDEEGLIMVFDKAADAECHLFVGFEHHTEAIVLRVLPVELKTVKGRVSVCVVGEDFAGVLEIPLSNVFGVAAIEEECSWLER